MKFLILVGQGFCCAALFIISDAIPNGAPSAACNNLTPAGPHNINTEQETPNPWMIDISGFDNHGTDTYYIPGYTYNGKIETIIEYTLGVTN